MKDETAQGGLIPPEKQEQLKDFLNAIEGTAEGLRQEWNSGSGDLPKPIDPAAYYSRKLQILDDIVTQVKKLKDVQDQDEKAACEQEIGRLLRSGGFYASLK